MGCCKDPSIPASALHSRAVYANNAQKNTNPEFCDNVVITSHYTAWNFVPIFLFQQFTRFANAYFLVVCVLQMIPSISITAGLPTTLVPLSAVIIFDGIVTAYEDYRRHQDDQLNNSRPCLVMNGTRKFVPKTWRDIQVGDILKVRRGEIFPADLLFLRAFTEDAATPEACYVMTAQLDGETNLKLKQALPATVSYFVNDAACAAFQGKADMESPNGVFSKFTGVITMGATAQGHPVEAEQALLRGCVLRNVDYVYAMVVYTGVQTKVRVKQAEIIFKNASVESFINRAILLLVAVLAIMCSTATVFFVFTTNGLVKHTYLGDDLDTWVTPLRAIEKVFTFFLLNNSFVPVSLYVTMKMARTGQKFFMERDLRMYHEDEEELKRTHGKEGSYPMRVRSMDLNDELGQISHVFSDKTGTFTLNYMEFRKLSCNGVAYGRGTTQIGLDRMKRMNQDTSELEALMEAEANSRAPRIAHVNFTDGSDTHPGHTLKADLAATGTVQSQALHDFIMHMATNHSVVIEKIRDETGQITGRQLSASSPDEEAFLQAAKSFGYRFDNRVANDLHLTLFGKPANVQVLHTLAYTQSRKRMSVIVKLPDSRIVLFVKGADNVIFSRLNKSPSKAEQAVRTASQQQIDGWGNDGLRTLVFAYKALEPNAYNQWNVQYIEATGDMKELVKRKKKQPNRIDSLMDAMERDLILQGATANEDKLQPGVPDTIEQLGQAGMAVWMLTGDKEETAINIGYSTRMLRVGMEKIMLSSSTIPTKNEFLTALYAAADRFKHRSLMPRKAEGMFALVIDEASLDHVFHADEDHIEEVKAALLTVTQACKAVICCRCRPDQKAAMVKMVKEGIPSARTLAIGDGANDVDMIQTAHVGVGIAGAEGVQAANASDYAIGRFRFLAPLVLVHGRWNYRRMSKLVLYMFYKNIAFVLAQFYFSIYNGWSGQKYYIELGTQTFNLIYTGWPILLLALFDQDVGARESLAFPILYKDGPAGRRLNVSLFMGWVVSAMVESVIVFFGCVFAMDIGVEHGETLSIYQLGVAVFFAITIVVSVRVAIETHVHSILYSVLLLLSVVSLVPCFLAFDMVDANGMKGGVGPTIWTGSFMMVLPLIIVITSLRIVVWKVYRRYFRTEARHVVQEAQLLVHNHAALHDAMVCNEQPQPGSGSKRGVRPPRPGIGGPATSRTRILRGSQRGSTRVRGNTSPAAAAGAGAGAGSGPGAALVGPGVPGGVGTHQLSNPLYNARKAKPRSKR